MKRRTFYIQTCGCSKNTLDKDYADALAQAGYFETIDISDADIVMLCTCPILERKSNYVYDIPYGMLAEINQNATFKIIRCNKCKKTNPKGKILSHQTYKTK